jgi:hypothetical protein
LVGTSFREDTSTLKANFITAWEVQSRFSRSCRKGLIVADGRTLYENVAMAFQY